MVSLRGVNKLLDNIFLKSILAALIYIVFRTLVIYITKKEIKKVSAFDLVFLPIFFILLFTLLD